jgi:hypothetical protein
MVMTTLPTKAKDLVERLLADDRLPFCPYDRRSPEYWTTPDDKPCKVCGTLNENNAPDLCNGTGSRIMAEAATAILALEARLGEINIALSDLNITNDELLRLRNSMESKEWVQVWSRACQSIIDCVRECRRIAVLSSPTTTRT